MKRTLYAYYVCHQVSVSGNFDDVCDLPGVGYFRLRDSFYHLILSTIYFHP